MKAPIFITLIQQLTTLWLILFYLYFSPIPTAHPSPGSYANPRLYAQIFQYLSPNSRNPFCKITFIKL